MTVAEEKTEGSGQAQHVSLSPIEAPPRNDPPAKNHVKGEGTKQRCVQSVHLNFAVQSHQRTDGLSSSFRVTDKLKSNALREKYLEVKRSYEKRKPVASHQRINGNNIKGTEGSGYNQSQQEREGIPSQRHIKSKSNDDASSAEVSSSVLLGDEGEDGAASVATGEGKSRTNRG